MLRAWCPLHKVGPDFPPTLLLHGQDDTDVPHEQSALLAAALAQAGVTHRWPSLPGTSHGFAGAQPQDVAAAESAVIEFLSAHTRPAAHGSA